MLFFICIQFSYNAALKFLNVHLVERHFDEETGLRPTGIADAQWPLAAAVVKERKLRYFVKMLAV